MISLEERARALLGTPHRHQGRNPSIGIDCVGLLVLALEDHPAAQLDPRAYSNDPHDGLLDSLLMAAFGSPVNDGPLPGDIVAMRFKGAVRHVAIVGWGTDGLTLIHTNSRIGRVVEHRLDDKWRRCIAAVFRPELTP